MKNRVGPALLLLALPLMTTGATCRAVEVAKTVLDVAELSCVLFHEEIEDDTTLAKTCGIAQELIPEVRKVIFARKQAMAKKAAAKASAAPSSEKK